MSPVLSLPRCSLPQGDLLPLAHWVQLHSGWSYTGSRDREAPVFVINETRILSQSGFQTTHHLPPSLLVGHLLFGGWGGCGSSPDKDEPKCQGCHTWRVMERALMLLTEIGVFANCHSLHQLPDLLPATCKV